MQTIKLEDALMDITVIRTTFETMDLFPPHDPIVAEMFAMVSEARQNLVDRLHNMVKALSGDLPTGFRSAALRLVTRGYPRGILDSMMKLDVFCAVAPSEAEQKHSDQLYVYTFNQEIDLLGLLSTPASEIYALFLGDILESVNNHNNYASKYLFDRFVTQKYFAFLFATYAGTDPFFYGGDDAEPGSGSGVPCRPVAPQKSGGGAKPIPDSSERGQSDES